VQPIKFEILGTILKINADSREETQIEFRWPIAEVIQVDNFLVVRTDPNSGSCDNCNVFAVDVDGNIVWTVADRKYVYDDSPYTKIVVEGGKVKIFNWDGLTVEVEPSTWKEVSAIYGK
jgi:hypothetical protein